MALTVSSSRAGGGPKQVRVADVTFDSSYSTGGLAVTPASFGVARVDYLDASPVGGLVFAYDYANSKLKAFLSAVPSGEFAYEPGAGNTKGATAITAAMGTADQAADAVNAGTWVAYQSYTTVNGAGGSLGTITLQPPFARNVNVTLKNATGGALNLFTGATSFTVTGTFRGAAQTETITLTLTGGQVALAASKFRAVAGSKPFDTITTVTTDATSLAGVIANSAGAIQIGVGPGTKFGFPVPPATGADVDVIEFNVAGVARAIATNSDYTNQTFNVGTTADATAVAINYRTAGVFGGTQYSNGYGLPEVLSGTDLSTVTTRVAVFGDLVNV